MRQARLQQAEEVAEAIFLAAVRGGRDQDQVPVLVRGEARDELVPQHPRLAAGAVGHAGVRLVDDQQVRAAVPELLPQPGALDEVGGDHDVRVPVEQRLAEQQAPFKPADRRRQHQLRVNAELGLQLPLPLLGQRRAAQHRHSGSVALLQQFRGDQARLDGLADAHVVGDQHPHGVLPQRHQQRHELVGAGLHGEPGQRAERSGARPEADPQRCPQQARAGGRSDVLRVGRLEGRRGDLLQLREHARDLVVTAAQRPQHEEVRRLRLRQHDPFPAAGGDQRADLVRCRHGVPSCSLPNTLG